MNRLGPYDILLACHTNPSDQRTDAFQVPKEEKAFGKKGRSFQVPKRQKRRSKGEDDEQ
jgi:hypothetical protein